MNSLDLDQLAKYDTPTVCNIIELFNVRPRNTGYMNKSIRACFSNLPPMVGFSLTATFRSLAPPPAGESYEGLTEQIDSIANLPGRPVIVFQDLDEPTAAATFGEVMCTLYKSFGSAGLITSGAGRDLEQVRTLDYPVFSNGIICSHGYCNIPQVNVPITVGGIQIRPGMLLHGDCNGVTTIPLDIANEIPDACQELMNAEQVILDYCRKENVSPKGLAEVRSECDELIRILGQRLQRKTSS